MYAAVLWSHSWLRYAVLGLGLWLLVQCVRGWRGGAPWSAGHQRAQVAFLGVLDTQMLLGLLLYFWLSPIAAVAMSDFGAAMKDSTLRFFGVEHIVSMLLAVVAAHAGKGRGKKKRGAARHRTTAIAMGVWLLLTLVAIPWPVLDVGRPLLRW